MYARMGSPAEDTVVYTPGSAVIYYRFRHAPVSRETPGGGEPTNINPTGEDFGTHKILWEAVERVVRDL